MLNLKVESAMNDKAQLAELSIENDGLRGYRFSLAVECLSLTNAVKLLDAARATGLLTGAVHVAPEPFERAVLPKSPHEYDRCSGDNSACYVDDHWRCGTSACGKHGDK